VVVLPVPVTKKKDEKEAIKRAKKVNYGRREGIRFFFIIMLLKCCKAHSGF